MLEGGMQADHRDIVGLEGLVDALRLRDAAAIECGHSTWKPTSTTTRPRRPASSSGRSVLNQVCTEQLGCIVLRLS